MAYRTERLSAQEFWRRYPVDETDRHDFKLQLDKPAKLQKPVVAFRNTRGGALLIGVDEQHPRQIVGVTWDQRQEERVQELARTPQPPVEITTELLSVDGALVAALHVDAAPRAVTQTSEGGVLVRAGPTNRTLFGDDLRRFLHERQSEPVEDQAVPGTSRSDLDTAAARAFFGQRRMGEYLDRLLAGWHFLTPDKRMTLAGLLLFGRDPQARRRRLCIDLVIFSGSVDGDHEFRERHEVHGRLPVLIDEADRRIYALMRKEAVIRGLVREEVPEYPPVAIREALVNAVVHRSYALDGSAVQIRLYDDAIEIQSPGRLPAHIQLRDLQTAQFSRNPRIMRTLRNLGYVEELGTGVDRMYRAMTDALLTAPEFSEPGDAFCVRFRNHSVFAAEDRLWVDQFDDSAFGLDEKVALVYARRHGAIRTTDLQQVRNLTSRRSAETLKALTARGLLRPVGHGRGTRYVLHGSAIGTGSAMDPGQRIQVIVQHAHRAGAVTNGDVQGLLGVDRHEALRLLEDAVLQGLLRAVGQRRGAHYVPTPGSGASTDGEDVVTAQDRRLIEDVLPVAAINSMATNEKVGGRQGHPSTLHLWWARRPLAAARAAVYGALVPARAQSDLEKAVEFGLLCAWDAPAALVDKARREVLAANGGVPPKVLDMFAGGGAIPLEAARLGCEVTAVELNPVAHLIEKCMLDYPQRFPGLADDVRQWGQRWVERAWAQLADLYPPVEAGSGQGRLDDTAEEGRRPLAYLWTRTVVCPNPALPAHRAPLIRQTWLSKKKGRVVALQPVVDRAAMIVRYKVRESTSAQGLGFDPSLGSRRGQTTCLACGATITADHVKAEGQVGRLRTAPLCAVVLKASGRGRDYLEVGRYLLPDDAECLARLEKLEVQPPDELISPSMAAGIRVHLYGLTHFRDLFTPRQLLTLCVLAAGVRDVHAEMLATGIDNGRAEAVATYLGLTLDKVADYSTALCRWGSAPTHEKVNSTYARQALPMVWDFAEANPFAGSSGDVRKYVREVAEALALLPATAPATVVRASATALPLPDMSQDAVVTDPPYYDNVSYSDIADFFYVWLKRSVGFLHPDHFGTELTPKRNEIVSNIDRHGGQRDTARETYENLMTQAFAEAHRVLAPGAPLVCIYAHKTTLGWATLVDALRTSGFTITEAWPLDTEMPQRSRGQNSAALASSIFLVARKRRENAGIGSESQVLAELDGIIAERRERLEKAGVTGADLVIATVGAGLKPFTSFKRVERDNGAELPAKDFLALVQDRVLDAVFGGLAGADPPTRFYVAAQFSYGYGWVPFDEANQLARMTGVELDSPRGLTAGDKKALVAKQAGKVRLRDYEARGGEPTLGASEDGVVAPLIDVAHGLLWRTEYATSIDLAGFLADAKPDPDLLRTVVQALAGKALRTGSADGKAPEAAAAERLLAAWRRLVEAHLTDRLV